jgi:uncharacterized protein (DUF1800 family)
MTADAWVNTGALLNRMNFAIQLVNGGRVEPAAAPERGGQPPVRPQAGRGRGPGAMARAPIPMNLNALAPDTSASARDGVVRSLLAGEASDSTKQTLARAETPQNLVALALGSPEFQRR